MAEPAPGNPSGDILHESDITPMQWLILLLGLIASMLEGFDIVIIAYTAPAISADWGISSQELGLVLSAGLFGMMLGAMFLSWLADRYGRRIAASTTLIIAGVTTCGVVYTDTVMQLVVLRMIAGLALGVLVATLPTLMGEFSPRRHRTLIIAVLIAGASMGAVIGGFISAALIADHGWQIIFFYAGALTLAVGILIQLLVPESIAFTVRRKPDGALARVNRTLSRIGQAEVAQLPPTSGSAHLEAASVVSLLTPPRRATTLLCWVSFFAGFLVVYFVSSWMPQVLNNAGLTQAQAIQGTALIPFGSIIGTTVIGWMARWWSLSRIITLGFLVGAFCLFTLSVLMQNLHELPFFLILVMLLLIGISLMGAFSNLYTVALTVYPAQIRSTGLGWCAGLGRAGAVISPLAAGVLIEQGISMPMLFILFAIPAFAAAFSVYFIRSQELP